MQFWLIFIAGMGAGAFLILFVICASIRANSKTAKRNLEISEASLEALQTRNAIDASIEQHLFKIAQLMEKP